MLWHNPPYFDIRSSPSITFYFPSTLIIPHCCHPNNLRQNYGTIHQAYIIQNSHINSTKGILFSPFFLVHQWLFLAPSFMRQCKSRSIKWSSVHPSLSIYLSRDERKKIPSPLRRRKEESAHGENRSGGSAMDLLVSNRNWNGEGDELSAAKGRQKPKRSGKPKSEDGRALETPGKYSQD